jgi:hypothetical protein
LIPNLQKTPGNDKRFTWTRKSAFQEDWEETMTPTRRALFLVATILAISAFLAPPVAAQKGAGGLPPAGTYRFEFTGANVSGFANNISFFLDASSGTDVARPDGAPATTTSGTQVDLFMFDYNTFTFTSACLILDHPSDFTIDNRLGGATLNTTLTPSTPTCPFGSQPLTTTISINASWTGIGPLGSSTGTSDYSCAAYHSESSNRGLTNIATANLTLTSGGTTTVFPPNQTFLNFNHFDIEAHGTIDPGCGPTGVGSGPAPAGHFHFFGLFANGFFGVPPFSFEGVSLNENNVSPQTGGPANTSSEDDLNVFLSGGSGCFVIPSSDVVTNGLVSASVNTTIVGPNPPVCNGSFQFGLSYPMTVNATWTAEGPVMTVHEQSNYQCMGYTQAQSVFVQAVGATSTATITMPDYFGNPQTQTFNGGNGDISQVSLRLQAHGVLQPGCFG